MCNEAIFVTFEDLFIIIFDESQVNNLVSIYLLFEVLQAAIMRLDFITRKVNSAN